MTGSRTSTLEPIDGECRAFRLAKLVDELGKLNAKQLDRARLIEHAEVIDRTLMACVEADRRFADDRLSLSWFERNVGTMRSARTVAEFEEARLAAIGRPQPRGKSRPRRRKRKFASTAASPAARAAALAEAVEDAGICPDGRCTPADELAWLTRRVTATTTDGDVMAAWFAVSPYVRRHVMLTSAAGVYPGQSLRLDRGRLIEACRNARGADAFTARPATPPHLQELVAGRKREAVAAIYKAFRALARARETWLARDSEGISGASVDFARAVFEWYGLAVSMNDMIGIVRPRAPSPG